MDKDYLDVNRVPNVLSMQQNSVMLLARAFLLATVLTVEACGKFPSNADGGNKECLAQLANWKVRNVDPPSLAKIWNIKLESDHRVDLDNVSISDELALRKIEATKDYDPGAYVLLDVGKSKCNRIHAFARQVDARFNCAQNYCYLVQAGSRI